MSEASEDTRVQIKGTFSVKKREMNGLNRVAALMNDDRVLRVPIAGMVEFVRHVDTRDGDEMTVELVVVEAAIAADGTDPHGYGATVGRIIEAQRKAGGKSAVADSLFTAGREAELDGQLEAITRDDVDTTRGTAPARSSEASRVERPGDVNASGDPVPEKSGAEILAERAEAKAATGGEGTLVAESGGTGDNAKPIRAPRTPRKATTRPAATTDPFNKTGEIPF